MYSGLLYRGSYRLHAAWTESSKIGYQNPARNVLI